MSGDYTYEEQQDHVPVDKQTGREIDHAVMKQLQREVTELKAMINELRAAARLHAEYSSQLPRSYLKVSEALLDKLAAVYIKTPAQSLTDHDRQVAERVREACIKAIQPCGRNPFVDGIRNLDLEDLIK